MPVPLGGDTARGDMSSENVEVVRSLFSALEDNDFETLLGLFHADVEWTVAEGRFRGVEGVVSAFVEWMEAWEEHAVEPEEFEAAAGDRVLATIHLTARGGQSGMVVDQRFFQVYTLRDGRISRMVEYLDRGRALEEAGL